MSFCVHPEEILWRTSWERSQSDVLGMHVKECPPDVRKECPPDVRKRTSPGLRVATVLRMYAKECPQDVMYRRFFTKFEDGATFKARLK